MDGIRQFLLHRIYLFRDNITADKYIFATNSSGYAADMKVYFNGTYEHMPLLFCVYNFQNAIVENITGLMGTATLGATRPANLPNLWRLEQNGQILCLYGMYRSSCLPGVVKEVKNISITLAAEESRRHRTMRHPR